MTKKEKVKWAMETLLRIMFVVLFTPLFARLSIPFFFG